MSASIGSTTSHLPSQGILTRALEPIKNSINVASLDNLHVGAVLGGAIACAGALTFADHKAGLTHYLLTSDLLTKIGGVAIIASAVGLFLVSTHSFFVKNIKVPIVARESAKIIVESSAGDRKKSILILSASNDWNGAYSSSSFVSKLKNLAETHAIKALTLSTENQAKQALNSMGKVDLIWVRAHGTSRTITFSDQFQLTEKGLSIMKQIGSHVVDGGSIILDCCSSGKGSNNIARIFSENCPHVTVYAPSGDTSEAQLELDADGKPSFSSFWCQKRSTTRIYKAKNLQPFNSASSTST